MNVQRELRPMCTTSGKPLNAQRRKVKRAASRSAIVRKVRCLVGLHNPPHDDWFEEYGAVMIGGACIACDDSVMRELIWIGNSWDFEGAASIVKSDDGTPECEIHTPSLIRAVNRHVKYLHSE